MSAQLERDIDYEVRSTITPGNKGQSGSYSGLEVRLRDVSPDK